MYIIRSLESHFASSMSLEIATKPISVNLCNYAENVHQTLSMKSQWYSSILIKKEIYTTTVIDGGIAIRRRSHPMSLFRVSARFAVFLPEEYATDACSWKGQVRGIRRSSCRFCTVWELLLPLRKEQRNSFHNLRCNLILTRFRCSKYYKKIYIVYFAIVFLQTIL